jgi:leader peptidase (prepilin peptidase)/N-methyltransferase
MVIAFSVVYGLVVGSFLTVVVDRVPRGASIVKPGSACGACDLRLGVVDLVPVLSWVALRGRCRRCRSSIGIEPLVLEVCCALLFALMAVHFGQEWHVIPFCLWSAGLLALAWIDLHTQRLPREIIHVTAAVVVPLLAIAALIEGEPVRILAMLIGAVISFAVMGLIYIASRRAMGDGDVRLAPLLGAALGWLNPGLAPVGLFFGFVSGAVVGLVMMVAGKASRKTAVPFGPFLVLGSMVAIVWGQDYIDLLLAR